MDLLFLKSLFRSGPPKVLGLVLALLAVLIISELLAVLFNLPDTSVMRPFG